MRDHDRRPPDEQSLESALDGALGPHIDVRRGLVEDQDPRLGQQRAREGDQLPLARRQADAPLADLGLVPVPQSLDERVGTDRLRRGANLLVARAGRPKAMFSRTVPENRKPSWGTIPSWLRSAFELSSRRSCPSTST